MLLIVLFTLHIFTLTSTYEKYTWHDWRTHFKQILLRGPYKCQNLTQKCIPSDFLLPSVLPCCLGLDCGIQFDPAVGIPMNPKYMCVPPSDVFNVYA